MPYYIIGKDNRTIKVPTEAEREIFYKRAKQAQLNREYRKQLEVEKMTNVEDIYNEFGETEDFAKKRNYHVNLIQGALNSQEEAAKQAAYNVAINSAHNAETKRLENINKVNYLKTALNILGIGSGIATVGTKMTSSLYNPIMKSNAVINGINAIFDVKDEEYGQLGLNMLGMTSPFARFRYSKPIPTATWGRIGSDYVIDFSKHLESTGLVGDNIGLYKQIKYNDNIFKKLNQMSVGGKRLIKPNIIRGGQAIPIGNNFYYMHGRSHEQGGIDVGKDLEVEGDEIMQVTPKSIKVFSAQPILNGISPAQAVLAGNNPNKVFNAQEDYKDRFNLNDDGTKKAELGKSIKLGEVVVTPRMSYINYTGNETNAPTKAEFISAKQNEARANAILNMQHTVNPTVPVLPNRLGRMFRRVAGDWFDDKDVIFMFGKDKNPSTCISTVTNAYGRMVPGNRTFYDKHKELGFELTKNRDHGDIVQTLGKLKRPSHAALITGFNNDGKILIDQSHGGITPDAIAHDTEYYDDIFEPDDMIYYRFVGNADDKSKWIKDYNNKYKNKKAMGGSISRHPFKGQGNVSKTTARLGTRKQARIGTEEDYEKLAEAIRKAQELNPEFMPRAIYPYGRLDDNTTTTTTTNSGVDGENLAEELDRDYYTFGYRRPRLSTNNNSKTNNRGIIFNALSNFHDWVNNLFNTDAPKTNDVQLTSKNTSNNTTSNNTDSNTTTAKPATTFTTNSTVSDIDKDYITSENSLPEVVVTAPAKKSTPTRTVGTARSNTKSAPAARRNTTTAKPVTTTTTTPTLSFTDTPVLNRNEELPYIYSKTDLTPVKRIINTEAPASTGNGKTKLSRRRVIADAPVKPKINTKTNVFTGIRDYIKSNPEEAISIGSNLLGSVGSWLTNNIAINRMREPNAPIPKLATKLKTRININPQLDKMRETVAEYDRNIRNNTASSAVALNRINRARFAGAMQTNELYGQKENAETELINRDKLNQQEVANANVDAYNTYLNNVNTFNNRKSELRSENNNALITGINSTIQNTISNREKQRNFNNTNMAMLLAYNNLPAERFYSTGLWTKQMFDMYRKLHPLKNND